MTKPARLRTFWWTVHRWIGLGLMVLLVPIAVSGALLVWHDPLDALLHPSRYAVTGTQLLQPSAYLASATAALDGSAQPVGVRFPEDEGWPVIVMARGAPRVEGGPIRFVNVYLDPPTARTLDVVDFRSSLIGWLHRFHENLTIPEYSGRAIVGWAGVGMLILSLTGIWLWWPRNGAFLPGLRWRRVGADDDQPPPSARVLDLDPARGGVIHRHLSRLPADDAADDVLDRADEPAGPAAGGRHDCA